MTRPRLLDLFSGAGGCAEGYHRAGFDVVGVDLMPQRHYPFDHYAADALTFPLDGFDVVHASPPCQTFTPLVAQERASNRQRLFDPRADLLTPMLARLADLDVPWIVENVPGAPMPAGAVTLCGSSFGLGVRRHRLFASNVPLTAPMCDHGWQADVVGVYGNPGGSSKRDGPRHSMAEWSAAMGIFWMSSDELAQAIPPAYSEHVGHQVMAWLHRKNPD